MYLPPRLHRLVEQVLAHQAALHGRTTRSDATSAVMTQMHKRGGPSAFGIGPADMIMALECCVDQDVRSGHGFLPWLNGDSGWRRIRRSEDR